MAIDPIAPVTPALPALPAANAPDVARALALARATIASGVAALGELAGGAAADTEGLETRGPSGRVDARQVEARSGAVTVDKRAPVETTIGDPLAATVKSAASRAAPIQSGLAPMMADIEVAVARPETPQPVRLAAKAVLERAIAIDRPVTALAVRTAVQSSGLFLEARLARAVAAPGLPVSNRPDTPAPNDMKAALLVFRAVVSTWLAKTPMAGSAVGQPSPASNGATATATPSAIGRPYAPTQAPPSAAGALASPSPDLHQTPSESSRPPITGAMRPAESGVGVAQASHGAAQSSASATASQTRTAAPQGGFEAPSATLAPQGPAPAMVPRFLPVGMIEDDRVELAPPIAGDEEPVVRDGRPVAPPSRPPSTAKPPPPYAGGPTSAQSALLSDMPEGLPPADVARRLLKGVDGAIARQELSQIASLPEARTEMDRPAEAKTSRWVFDLPFQTPQGVAVAQFEISRDGGGGGADDGREIERTWRARFSLDVEPLGPVHVQIALTGASTRVGLWAERPEAMARLQAGEAALSAALRQAELSPEVAFHAGSPTVALTAPGRFVDRAS